MKFFFKIFLWCLCFAVKTADCQIVKYSNDFLSTGSFSKEEALGCSNFSSQNGSLSIFSNPSRLDFEDYKADFSVMHDNYFSSLATLNLLSGVFKADSLTFLGFGFLRFGVDDIQNTINLFDDDGNMDFSRISYFSVADYALFMSVSRKYKNFFFGTSLKLIYRHQGKFANAYGFGFDVAASYRKDKFSVSAVVKDLTTTFNFWTINSKSFDSTFFQSGNSLPVGGLEQTSPSLNLSASYFWKLKKFVFATSFATESYFFLQQNYLISSKFFSSDIKAGIEISYSDIVFMRAGVSDFQKDNTLTISKTFSCSPSFGAGVKLLRFAFDYAFKMERAIERNSNVFTLGVKF